MINFEDYKKPNGDYDWKAYHDAQVEAGENCSRCRQYILSTDSIGRRMECRQCEEARKPNQLRHDKFARCPACSHLFSPSFDLAEIGDYVTGCCPECDEQFSIRVQVEFHYTSPALKAVATADAE